MVVLDGRRRSPHVGEHLRDATPYPKPTRRDTRCEVRSHSGTTRFRTEKQVHSTLVRGNQQRVRGGGTPTTGEAGWLAHGFFSLVTVAKGGLLECPEINDWWLGLERERSKRQFL